MKNPNIPYFYIIRHKNSGIKYAGCQYSIQSDPSRLLKKNGYLTSSKIVQEIIAAEGIESFDIEDIILETDLQIPFNHNLKIKDYEYWFLSQNKCAISNLWFNKHDGTNYGDIWNDETRRKHKEIMNSEEVWNKIWATWNREFGGHPNRNPVIKEKSRQSNFTKYGVDNYSKTEEFKVGARGENNPMNLPGVRDKHLDSMQIAGPKISLALQNRPIVQCPHCGLQGKSSGAMNQFHFEYCNKKPGNENIIRPPRNSKSKI